MLASTLLALLALTAALEDSPSYKEGLELYQELEFEGAIERFREAAEEDERTDAERALLLVWQAMSSAGIGDDEAARAAARRALELDLDVQPPDIAPPKVRGFLEEMRDEVAAEQAPVEPQLVAEPEPVAVNPAPPPSEPPWMMIAGGTVAAVGAVGVAGAGLFGALTAASLAAANDRDAFQVDAVKAVDAANAQAITAGVLAGAGVALAGVGGTLITLDLLEE